MSENCNHKTCQGEICRRPRKKAIRKPVRKVSKKRAKDNREYDRLRKRFLEANPVCQANLQTCTVKATQVHHKKGRTGKDFLDTSTWLACCGTCHNVIELNPAMAKQLGLSESRLTPVLKQ